MSLRTCGFEGGLRDRVGGGCSALPQSPKPPTHSVAPGKMSAIASSGEPASLLLPLPFTQRVGSTTRCLLEKQRRWPRRAAAVTPRTRPAIYDFVCCSNFRGCVNHHKDSAENARKRGTGNEKLRCHAQLTSMPFPLMIATLISTLVLTCLSPSAPLRPKTSGATSHTLQTDPPASSRGWPSLARARRRCPPSRRVRRLASRRWQGAPPGRREPR